MLIGCTQGQLSTEPPVGDEKVLRALDSYHPVYKLNADGRVTDLILQGKHVLPVVTVEVGKLTALQRLDLGASSLSDESLIHLRGLTNLKVLRLGSTSIGDPGLIHLEGLQELRHIWILFTKVTPEGAKRSPRGASAGDGS